MDPKDRPAWMAPLYPETCPDPTERNKNWKTFHLKKEHLTSIGAVAWKFYFAFIKYNEEAKQLRSGLSYDKGFNLIDTVWNIVSEVDNGGFAQYIWNVAVNDLQNFDENSSLEKPFNCLKKLYQQFPTEQPQNAVTVMQKALESWNRKLFWQQIKKLANAKTQSEKLELMQKYIKYGWSL